MSGNLTLKKIISVNDSSFNELYKIYTDSFIDDEIREIDQNQLDKEIYNLYSIEMNNEVAGLIATWNLGNYVFVEHVAISSTLRGQGLGSIVFEEFHKMNAGKCVVLDVEIPYNKDCERRIEFYKRLNYFKNMYEYFQPPLSKGKSLVPMYLMSLGKPLSPEEFLVIRDLLFREVYQYILE